MIRILVVDDHPVVREGLVSVLEDEADFQVVGTAATAEAALRQAPSLRPDVVLLDLELPGMDGVAAIGRLAALVPDSRVVVFTAYGADERVVGAIQAGARGYLLKGARADEIARAIRAVHGGGTALAPEVASAVIAALRAPRGAALTRRELEVLRLVAQGLANKQIARDLAISERTVKFHVTSIFAKLGADNRAQAVALAARHRLL